MRVLVVEDDENKSKQVVALLQNILPRADLNERRSYRSGLKEIIDGHPDLVVLDMSMPTFDITAKDKGGRTRAYAGRDILDEVLRRQLDTRAIVLTQYETFGEGTDKKSLDQLKDELQRDFPSIFCGAVYYHPAQSDWMVQLTNLVSSIIEQKDAP